jgi:3D (Asp-Asp-Asp) domain-containing protein
MQRSRKSRRLRINWVLLVLVLCSTTVAVLAIIGGNTVLQKVRGHESEMARLEQVIDKQTEQIDQLRDMLVDKDLMIDELETKNEQLAGEINALQVENDKLRTIPAIVTAYAPLDPESIEGFDYSGDPRYTATGTLVSRGVGAADFRRLPPGTVLDVPGYGLVTIEDTGGAMRANEDIQIDVVFDTRDEAFEWGRQSLEVKVVSVPKQED